MKLGNAIKSSLNSNTVHVKIVSVHSVILFMLRLLWLYVNLTPGWCWDNVIDIKWLLYLFLHFVVGDTLICNTIPFEWSCQVAFWFTSWFKHMQDRWIYWSDNSPWRVLDFKNMHVMLLDISISRKRFKTYTFK